MPTINVEGVATPVGVPGEESIETSMIKEEAVSNPKLTSTPWEKLDPAPAKLLFEPIEAEARIWAENRVEVRGLVSVKAEKEITEGNLIAEMPKSVYEHTGEGETGNRYFSAVAYTTEEAVSVPILVSGNKIYYGAGGVALATGEIFLDTITYSIVEYEP